ncbi:MAG: Gfo/Idh/MocA family oxidoreductase, partial [Clostridia bacterium]|nr:Gfo/Idh/MocA family oxidoreductase [Clostridia bacterium]
MRKLRVALVGCGSIGKNYHLRAYQSLTDIAEVVAICDINPERLKAASEEYNITHAYASIEELLANEKDLDYVDVCTWPSAHAPVAVAAAKAGLHVLCEKPLAATVEQGLEIEKAVKEAGVNFMLAVVTRYGGEQAKFVEMRDAGVFGDIYYAKVAYIRRRGTPGGWFTNKEFAGGGPVLDIGVHAIDRTWYLMGRPKPVTVSAETSYRIGDTAKAAPAKAGDNGLFGGWSAAGQPGGGINDVEDSAAAFIRFED